MKNESFFKPRTSEFQIKINDKSEKFTEDNNRIQNDMQSFFDEESPDNNKNGNLAKKQSFKDNKKKAIDDINKNLSIERKTIISNF